MMKCYTSSQRKYFCENCRIIEQFAQIQVLLLINMTFFEANKSAAKDTFLRKKVPNYIHFFIKHKRHLYLSYFHLQFFVKEF